MYKLYDDKKGKNKLKSIVENVFKRIEFIENLVFFSKVKVYVTAVDENGETLNTFDVEKIKVNVYEEPDETPVIHQRKKPAVKVRRNKTGPSYSAESNENGKNANETSQSSENSTMTKSLGRVTITKIDFDDGSKQSSREKYK